jgi:CRISPR/Cas system endoribonuclease Cas6 (RAMP superfamily)
MLFEYDELSNPKQILECKNVIVEYVTTTKATQSVNDSLMETYSNQEKDMRLLSYKLLVDKFNTKYSVLSESQKQLLNQYITNVNDTETLKKYIKTIIPTIKTKLSEQVSLIDDEVTRIKVKKLSEMLCNVETMKTIKESHILSLLRYFDLVTELTEIHK